LVIQLYSLTAVSHQIQVVCRKAVLPYLNETQRFLHERYDERVSRIDQVAPNLLDGALALQSGLTLSSVTQNT
jgi:hypothetical protein